jgi:ABC-type uncharacterized transport system ATPase subunit
MPFLDEPTIGLDEVADLTLEEPDIEDIVRRIYRGETPP